MKADRDRFWREHIQPELREITRELDERLELGRAGLHLEWDEPRPFRPPPPAPEGVYVIGGRLEFALVYLILLGIILSLAFCSFPRSAATSTALHLRDDTGHIDIAAVRASAPPVPTTLGVPPLAHLAAGLEGNISRRTPVIAFTLYIASIFAANWAIVTFGVVPVGFGLVAPAAVYVVGVTFTLRDFIPRARIPLAILIGAALSAILSPQLALASGIAFATSELLDFAVYSRLRWRGWLPAVVGSNVVGLVIDSALFLALAFGSLEFLPGQIVGKATMTLLALPVIALIRRARPDRFSSGPATFDTPTRGAW